MARRQKKRAETLIIAREEWDMAHLCPPNQLRRCWCYEFTREFVRQGNSAPESAHVILPREFAELLKDAKWLENKSFLLTINVRPELETAEHLQPPPGVLGWLTRYSPTSSVRLRLDEPPKDVTPLVIDWDESNSELAKSFKNLIEEIRPRQPNRVRRENLSEKYKADLKALGAFRLLAAGYTCFNAMEYTASERNEDSETEDSETEDSKPLFMQKTEWTNAKKRAESIIENWSG